MNSCAMGTMDSQGFVAGDVACAALQFLVSHATHTILSIYLSVVARLSRVLRARSLTSNAFLTRGYIDYLTAASI